VEPRKKYVGGHLFQGLESGKLTLGGGGGGVWGGGGGGGGCGGGGGGGRESPILHTVGLTGLRGEVGGGDHLRPYHV